jgi:hypothetical protein
VLLTVGCVWLGWKVNKAQKQRAAVAWVHEMGGQVYYDCNIGDSTHLSAFDPPDPPGPPWLEELVGIDFLSDVYAVNCSGIPALFDISPLANLTELHSVNLHRTSVSDLSPLASLTKLTYLDISLTPTRSLTPLEYLAVLNTAISKEEIAMLRRALPNCEIYYEKIEDIQVPPSDLRRDQAT